jgi:catechol 2,3-dioxygenase-like lactoylglutathione lyase family enzyme
MERSLPFYRALLAHLGPVDEGSIEGERGEVDAIAAWLRDEGAAIEGGPGERDYTPGYYAVFFFDPDGLKLEVVHQPPRPSVTPA